MTDQIRLSIGGRPFSEKPVEIKRYFGPNWVTKVYLDNGGREIGSETKIHYDK